LRFNFSGENRVSFLLRFKAGIPKNTKRRKVAFMEMLLKVDPLAL
jgi:hypothetical protein